LENLLSLPWEAEILQEIPVVFITDRLLTATLTPGIMKGESRARNEEWIDESVTIWVILRRVTGRSKMAPKVHIRRCESFDKLWLSSSAGIPGCEH